VTGIGAPDYPMALNGWINRTYPYGDVWSNDAIQAARLGLGDEVLSGMKRVTRTYQSYPNGLTNDANGHFEYLGTHLSAINESLLQSYNDKVRVFPAIPNDPGFVGRFTLLARGGFLVSSEYESKDIKYVALKSLYGNPVTIVNPWGSARARVRRAVDNTAVLTTAEQEFTFNTASNTVYIIERMADPLSNHTHKRLTGTTNNDAKQLADSSAILGAFIDSNRIRSNLPN
jgi:hypothetical protein